MTCFIINKVDLPRKIFETVATTIWIQTRDPGDPGNTKDDNAEYSDYKAAKLENMFGDKYLPTLRRRDEIWSYSIGIAHIDDEIKEKLNFRICPNSTISLLVSRSEMPDMRCFSIGRMKNQHDAILESFGTTEEIIISMTRLPSTTYSLLSSSFSYS